MANDDTQLGFADLLALSDPDRLWSLAAWYALPLPADQAQQLLAHATQCQQQAIARDASRLPAQLLSWIASFWLKGDAQMQYDNLLATVSTPHDRALVELIQGQLLSSVKRRGARAALARGFQLATGFLTSEDYFLLMKRHELLAFLRCGENISPPATLHELRVEAQVIKRLQRGRQKDLKQMSAHSDTLD